MPATVHRLERETFRTSRLLDFASEKELQAQTGHEKADWPLVVMKEGFDNALDACEDAEAAPVIDLRVDLAGITITDNGPGIPAATVASVLDFNVRVSSREAYVSPTRGAQGNALKTLVTMPFVVSGGETGRIEITAQRTRHVVDFRIDHIRQTPVINYWTEASDLEKGTVVKLHWPHSASSMLTNAQARILQVAEGYAWLNPNLMLTVDCLGDRRLFEATDPGWQKWRACDPTSPHWYTQERQSRLVAALVAADADAGRARTVREFVATFRGLSGTGKQKTVLEALGLSRSPLSALIKDGQIDTAATAALFEAMRLHSKPVKPAALGPIGRAHFEARFRAARCEMESFDYRKVEGMDAEGVPYIVETAFAWRGDTDDDPDDRRLITGINWSASITNPFRVLGPGQSLDSILQQQRVGRVEPVIFVLHVSCPRVDYLDRGKSSVAVRP